MIGDIHMMDEHNNCLIEFFKKQHLIRDIRFKGSQQSNSGKVAHIDLDIFYYGVHSKNYQPHQEGVAKSR